MTHFGIICPTGSHLTSCFPLGFELQRRGHCITFLNVVDVQDKILAANFRFRAFEETGFPGSQVRLADRIGKLTGMAAVKETIKVCEQDFQIILQKAPAIIKTENIQALLVDQCSPVGGIVADFLNIPFISLCNALPLNREISIPPPFTSWRYSSTWGAKVRNQTGYALFNVLAKRVRRLIDEYRQQWKLPRYSHPNYNFSQLAQLSQQPVEFEFPRTNLPPHFHFTGPYHNSIGRENVSFPWEKLTGQPLVYASLGTVLNQLLPVFEAIAAACVGLDVQLVISLGGGMPLETMSNLPGSPLVVSYAPQLELLKKAVLTITHAGLNTALESLTHGVPMVAIPITNDQPGVAARIAWSGAGEMIPVSNLTVARLRSTIHKVLTQDSYKAQASRLQLAIQNSGGVDQAANIIESAIATGKPVLRSTT
ncbi:glycosyltransferase [Chlorogloea sp. CCALA 695]|uniref:glycosyltransferase n=1 Tax=Chlorogloea sp. CCALA 695 TaxID=2107693 RepID=UPI000D05A710|nr:glycosyltransferase [Chlorogloea sp. CCALA 695]PSB27385.1 glycosyl transferase family 1 [Chlorogloea sp. CCALA 695]